MFVTKYERGIKMNKKGVKILAISMALAVISGSIAVGIAMRSSASKEIPELPL